MKLALVISSLGGGGAERVMSVLAGAWAREGNEVTLITLASAQEDKYPLDSSVRRVALNVAGRSSGPVKAIGNNFMRIRALRSAIKACRPDAAISFMANTNVLSMLAATGLQVPVIVSERVFVEALPPRGIRSVLYRLLYRRAAAVVAQTRRAARDIERRAGCATVVIPNPVWHQQAPAASNAFEPESLMPSGSGSHTLLAVGRLAPQKGFDLLINAFAQIANRHPDWNLTILGDGMLRNELTQAITARGLAHRISMPGFSDRVREAMRQAELFVLSSRFEGFPNALLEAMSEGVACVSFDCETGPRELIRHGENGLLVAAENASALAAALDTLMQDDGLRASLGARAREVRTLYSLPVVLGQWNALLESVVAREDRMKAAEGSA